MSSNGPSKEKKTYHKQATGHALATAQAHAGPAPLKLYGACFCPFVQRVWIALEATHVPYQYVEVDPYAKPQELLDINSRGLVPALRHGDWGMYESTVVMEYLEDLAVLPSSAAPNGHGDGEGAHWDVRTGAAAANGTAKGPPSAMGLLPRDPQARAHARLWPDHANRNLIPAFYRCLQAQDAESQTKHAGALRDAIATLVDAAHPTGPFFLGQSLGFVDAQLAPWVLRLRRVLTPYRGWPALEAGTRWAKWVEAIEADESVQATTSTDELYLDSYERYAENRPGTSQLADAVNEGRGLP